MSLSTQSVRVSVAHRYAHGLWSHERNRQVYGEEASLDGIGNNLLVEFAGRPEEVSQAKKLLDHRCLFKDEPRFVTEASTLERITLWLAQELQRPVTITEADRLRCRAEPSSIEVEISIQCRNLRLGFVNPVDGESGLALRRRDVSETVDQVFKEFSSLGSQDEHAWGDRLWQALSTRLKNLKWVTVDLGGQKTVRLAESPLRNG